MPIHHLTRSVAGALAIVAVAAPTAGARPVDFVAHPQPARAPAPTITRSIDDGFDWGSGAIGAGAAAAVLLLGAAGVSVRALQRSPR